jgi:hypothetical protein
MAEALTTGSAPRSHDQPAARLAWPTALRRSAGVGLIAGSALLPGILAVLIAFFYLGEWPTENPFDQVFYAVIVGVVAWLVLSVVFLGGLADVRNGDSAAYDELVMRAETVEARIHALTRSRENPGGLPRAELPEGDEPGAAHEPTRQTALKEAREILRYVRDALDGTSPGSALRWAAASGYTSVWRELHRAEEAVLAAELRESLYAEAVDDEARLMRSRVDEKEKLLGELRRILGDEKRPRPRAAVAMDLDTPEGRALMRKIRFVLNSYRDDLFQRFVRIRNGMFATLVYVGLVFDGLLALTVVAVPERHDDAIAVGLAYFLVGALVGLFAELYGASKGQRGAVHDYGLALVRLLTIPVLSGIAAVLGVVLTRAGSSSNGSVTLDQIFSLQNYPLGIVVAAVFGLTPGLLLERLRTQTNEYKEELMKSAAGTPRVSASTNS